MAFERVLAKSKKTKSDLLEALQWTMDPMADFEFPDWHQAYFEFSSLDIKTLAESKGRRSIDATDRHGRTLLSWVAQIGDNDMVRRLVELRAHPTKADKRGWTPLHYAVSDSNYECVKTLLQLARADPNCQDMGGYAALFFAESVEMIQCLFTHGGRVTSHDLKGENGITDAALYERSAETFKGRFALEADLGVIKVLQAIYCGDCNTLKLLLCSETPHNTLGDPVAGSLHLLQSMGGSTYLRN